MASWFVVRCKAGKEDCISAYLQKFHIVTFSPKIKKPPALGRSTKFEAMFPGYIFISKESSFEKLRLVKYAVGVKEIVSFADFPAEVSENVIGQIVAMADCINNKNNEVGPLYQGGQPILMNIGGVTVSGSFVQYAAQDRAIVLLNILCSRHRVSVDVDNIHRVD